MPIYAVRLERTVEQTVFIEADDKTDAAHGAWELAEEKDWMPESSDEYAVEVARPPRRYWTGGSDGRWVGTT